jgi:hypothetical protein
VLAMRLVIANFLPTRHPTKFVAARRRNQHARRVRSPENRRRRGDP